MPIVAHQNLRRVCQEVAVAVGTPADIALAVAESLVEANLAGHDSHGILRLPWYVDSIREGTIHAAARPAVMSRSGARDPGRGTGEAAAPASPALMGTEVRPRVASVRQYGSGRVRAASFWREVMGGIPGHRVRPALAQPGMPKMD